MAALEKFKEEECRESRKSISLHSSTGSDSNLNLYDTESPPTNREDPLQVTVLQKNIPDGGYGWVIVICVFLNYYSYAAALTTFSVLLVSFKDKYPEQSIATLSLLETFKRLSQYFAGIFVSAPSKLFGLRATTICGQLFIATGFILSSVVNSFGGLVFTYGILTGMGISFVLSPSMIIVQLYFDKRRALAAGIATSGKSFALLTAPVVTQYLLDFYTLQQVILLLAIIPIQTIVFAALYRPLPGFEKLSNTDEKSSVRQILCAIVKDVVDFRLLKNLWFSGFLIAGFCMYAAVGGTIIHAPLRLVWRGFSRDKAALSMVFLGIGSLISRIIYSVLGQFIYRLAFMGISVTLGGIVLAATALIQPFWGIMSSFLLFTFILNGTFAIQATVMVDVFGKDNLIRRAALMNMANAFGAVVGVFFIGWMFDVLNDYDKPYYILGAVQLTGGLFILIMAVWHKRKTQQCG